MALSEDLQFDLVGSLVTSQGVIPTFLRASAAATENYVNGSLRLTSTSIHQPRFTSTGALVLEQASENLLSYPLDLTQPQWVKGSNILIQPDKVQGMDSNYLADRITVSEFLGNIAANTLTRSIQLGSGETFTVTVFLALAGGNFGGSDIFRVDGDVVAVQSASLGAAYNNRRGSYSPISLTFSTAGAGQTDFSTLNTTRTVNFSFYIEKSVSINWGGTQLEAGTTNTTFIAQGEKISKREADSLNYPNSPVEGLGSFAFYIHLERWRGDGGIVDCGNFAVGIFNGKIRATCGVVSVEDPGDLPQDARIAVRVSQSLGRVSLYVNEVMVAAAALSGFAAAAAELNFIAAGLRQIRCAYFFGRDVSDGSIDVGGTVLGELLTLFERDSLFSELAEGYAKIFLPPVRCKSGSSVAVRFPQFLTASQEINTLNEGVGSNLHRARFDILGAYPLNAFFVNDPWVAINKTRYDFGGISPATKADAAAAIAAAINLEPRREPVVASHTPPNEYFTVTHKALVSVGDTGLYDVFEFDANSTYFNAYLISQATRIQNTLTVDNAVDYVIGPASIFRDYAFIADIQITGINTGTNTITFFVTPNSLFAEIQPGDVLNQARWSLRIGPNCYFAHHLEDLGDIRPLSKSLEGVRYENIGLIDRTFTPYIQLSL